MARKITRKKTAVGAPSSLISLIVSREDAALKLAERIERGKELLQREIGSWEQLKTARGEYYKWSDYNKELLRRLFSNGMLAAEYSDYVGVGFISLSRPVLDEDVRELRGDIKKHITRLESIHERLELFPVETSVSSGSELRSVETACGGRVFVVHGHDEAARELTARFLERLGFEAIILHEKPNEGRTIIEKLEHYASVDFAVVLLTPDDVGAVATSAKTMNSRSRQNVVLELGYFFGKLGRDKVCALYKGGVELPSDMLGVIYIALDSEGAWKYSLAKELRAAGLAVDMNKV